MLNVECHAGASGEPDGDYNRLADEPTKFHHSPSVSRVFAPSEAKSSRMQQTSSSNMSALESELPQTTDDPYHRIRTTSTVSAFVTFLKALFGVSLLSQPRILGETGLVLGTVTHVVIIFACVFACYLLLKARSMAAMPRRMAGEDRSGSRFLEQIKSLRNLCWSKPSGTAFGAKGRLVTYGDLARQLLGARIAMAVSWLIIVLHILFASGMMSVTIYNLSAFLGWNVNDGPDSSPEGRLVLTNLLFPIVALLLQLSTLKDLFVASATGLLVYLVGCVGSMMYSAISFSQSEQGGPPEDMWQWRWMGIPVFVASTVYAIEGINLALPTANGLEDQQRAIPLLFAAVILFGVLTIAVSWIGYIGGMGGGPGTHHGEGACRDLSYCLYSESVRSIYQVSLSVALILTLPVILYPSTEMLEIWATERDERREKQRNEGSTNLWYTTSGAFFDEGSSDSLEDDLNNHGKNDIASQKTNQAADLVTSVPTNDGLHYSLVEDTADNSADKGDAIETASQTGERVSEMTTSDELHQRDALQDGASCHADETAAERASPVEELITTVLRRPDGDVPSKSHPVSRFEKHFFLRFILAIIVCIFGAVEELISTYVSFVRGIGLSLAGFVLPPILYMKACERVGKPASGIMKVALFCLMCFGIFNMVLVCMSAFTEQEFIP